MEPNQPQPAQPLQPTTPQPVIQTPQMPIKPKKAWKKWILIILVLLLLFSIPIGVYLVLNQLGINPKPSKVVVQNIKPTPTPNPTVNWKTYTNKDLGFSFKYPNRLRIASESSKQIILEDIIKQNFPTTIFVKLESQYNLKTLKTCEKAEFQKDIITHCLSNDPMNYKKINGVSVVSFYTSWGYLNSQSGTNYVYQVVDNPKIEFMREINGGGQYFVLDEIVSTFKFTDQASQMDITNWKTYTHPEEKISFKYPEGWSISTTEQGGDLGYENQKISNVALSKKDTQGKGTYNIHLRIGGIYDEGAGSAIEAFEETDTITLDGKTAYILKIVNSLYNLSSCNAPKKCLFRTKDGKGKIDFYASHFNPGDQGVEPFPDNDPLTEVAHNILKTISY